MRNLHLQEITHRKYISASYFSVIKKYYLICSAFCFLTAACSGNARCYRPTLSDCMTAEAWYSFIVTDKVRVWYRQLFYFKTDIDIYNLKNRAPNINMSPKCFCCKDLINRHLIKSLLPRQMESFLLMENKNLHRTPFLLENVFSNTK